MKYLKMLGLAAIAALALTAFAGAGSASAAVLCEVNTMTTSCAANNKDYPSKTVIKSTLKAGTKAVLKSIWTTVECSKSTVEGETTNTGGGGVNVTGKITALTFSECTCSGGARAAHPTAKVLGNLEINYTSADNGTLTGKNTNVTIECKELASCNYGTATGGTQIGTVTGGAPATLKAEASLPRIEEDSSVFICGSSGSWTAEYEVTSPTALYIAEK